MAEDNAQKTPRSRRTSSVPPITENGDTITALVNSTPLLDHAAAAAPADNPPRNRRRSSVSIIQALVNSSHLLATIDARKRNFLVGSGRQTAENQMQDLHACFPSGRMLTVMMVTWNTGEAPKLYEQNYTPTPKKTVIPKERMLDDMSDILLPTFIDYVSDVIIVCTQEMSVAKKRIDWEILLQEVIGPTHVLFHSVHFGTLSLCIFLRRDLIWYCTEPEEDIIKFRAMGPVRTKGSLAITFNLFGTSFMIINSHFEAGDDREGRSNRRLNFQNTITKMSIPHEFVQRTGVPNKRLAAVVQLDNERVGSASSLDSVSRPGVGNDCALCINQLKKRTLPSPSSDTTKACDCVLWAGDMNFRLDMSAQEVLDHLKNKNHSELLLKDEFLSRKKNDGDAYADFKEADITFEPTYKFDLRYAEDTYAKHRTPSYTDRILYRDKPTSPIECTQYKSVEGVKHSDHKPVVAHFRIKLKPGLHKGNLAYGKFNHDVYRRGCEQRERHHSLGVGVGNNAKRRAAMAKSSVCVLQ